MGIDDFALVELGFQWIHWDISSGIRSSHPFFKMDLDKVKNTHNLLTYIRNLLTSPLRMEKTEFLKANLKWVQCFCTSGFQWIHWHQIESPFLNKDHDIVNNTHNLTYIHNLLTSPQLMGKVEFLKANLKWASMFLH